MRVFDLADPAAPREIGFMPVEGIGLHRIWWVGGRYAYASAHLDGFIDHILAVIDLADPAVPPCPPLIEAFNHKSSRRPPRSAR